MLNRLQDVFRSFQQRHVKYLVIGGIAAVLHGQASGVRKGPVSLFPHAAAHAHQPTSQLTPAARPGNWAST